MILHGNGTACGIFLVHLMICASSYQLWATSMFLLLLLLSFNIEEFVAYNWLIILEKEFGNLINTAGFWIYSSECSPNEFFHKFLVDPMVTKAWILKIMLKMFQSLQEKVVISTGNQVTKTKIQVTNKFITPL